MSAPEARSRQRRTGAPAPAHVSSSSTSIVSTGVTVLGPERRRMALLVVLAVTSGLIEATTLYLVARLATLASVGEEVVTIDIGPAGPTEVELVRVAWLAGGLLALLVLLAVPLARLAASISQRTLLRLRRQVVDAYLGARWEERAGEREGHLQMLLADYAPRAERFVLQIATIAIATSNLAVMGAVAAVVSPLSVVVIGSCLGLLAVATRPLIRRSGTMGSRFAKADQEFSSEAAQTARVAQEIAAFDVADEVAKVLDAEARVSAGALRRIRFFARLTPSLYQYGALGVVVVTLGILLAAGGDDLTGVGPVVLLLVRSLGYAKQLQTAQQAAHEFAPYVWAISSECERYEKVRAPRTGQEPASFERISFEQVTFSYQPGRPVLDQVDLEIRFGEAIGLVGSSGGGKSTLVQLLLGLRTPTRGRISIDGTDRAEIHPVRFARLVAFVPQENRLMRASVADNIRFHRDLPLEAVEQAARDAHLHEDVMRLPQGYDTVVGPGAHDLSGGQKQRLGIARALVGDPRLLVLDEPTSALDARSENLIKETLEDLVGNCALLIVAHRPATLQLCDRVVVLEGGRLVERAVVGGPP